MTNPKVYGWNTSKTETGYRWQVTAFQYGAGVEVVEQGVCATRAQAVARAKRAVSPR